MPKFRTALVASLLAAAALAAGCTEDPLYPRQAITVTSADLPTISGDAVYELWLSYPPESATKSDRIEHDLPEFFSAGRFIVVDGALRSPDGGPVAFAIPEGYNPALVGEALVSVEDRSDTDGEPDALMLWGRFLGDASRGHAMLELATPRTFDTAAIRERRGSFVIEAPTSAASQDALSGIWFLTHRPNSSTGDTLTAGIDLPPQPLNHDNDRWTYEAWLVDRSAGAARYLSLGRFRNPASADDNGPGPAAGPLLSAAYRFPGEDFIEPNRRLADSAYGVVVSLQPAEIAMSAPFVRLLELESMPSGVVSREEVNLAPTPKLPLVEVTIAR